MTAAIQVTRHTWEFRIEANEMGRIFLDEGFVSLLFESAHEAQQFMENYPSFSQKNRSYEVIQNRDSLKRLDIMGPTGVVQTIDALKEAIDAKTSWDDEIINPFRYTYHTYH